VTAFPSHEQSKPKQSKPYHATAFPSNKQGKTNAKQCTIPFSFHFSLHFLQLAFSLLLACPCYVFSLLLACPVDCHVGMRPVAVRRHGRAIRQRRRPIIAVGILQLRHGGLGIKEEWLARGYVDCEKFEHCCRKTVSHIA